MEGPGRSSRLGFGVVARAEGAGDALSGLGARLERLGYQELWANDGRTRSGLATLAAAADGAGDIELGLGVAPLSERSPAQIAAEVEQRQLPHDRLILGVGTGDGASLAAVREGVAELRGLLPGVRIAIAALGPRMCRLGGEIADVVLLNWAFPERISWSRRRIEEGAAQASRPAPRVAAYVRLTVGPDAADRLAAAADHYRRRPRPYARLFEEQAAGENRVPGVAALDPDAAPALLAPYRSALDTCVVRALPAGDSVDELLVMAAAAAGRSEPGR